MQRRNWVLGLIAVGLAGVVWAAEPIHDALEGVSLAQAQTGTGTPVAAQASAGAAIAPAPMFVSARDPLQLQPYDRVLGQSNAPVTVIEYASLMCGHCRDFHTQVVPPMVRDWVQTGRVRYVLRDMPWDNLALGMAATARCAPAAQYYPLVSALFEAQTKVAEASDKVGAIAGVAAMAGMSRGQVEACIRDPGYQALSTGMKNDAMSKLSVRGTPTLFVNGTRVDGFVDYKDFSKTLSAALAAAQKK